MTFRYFAYGSNMWEPQMRSRCPSASFVGTGTLDDWLVVYDKPSTDGSAKANIRPEPGASVSGVIYEIDDSERPSLDAAEPRYSTIETGELGLTYVYAGMPSKALPYDWYLAMVMAGAASHGLPGPGSEATPDPTAAGIVPADETDLAEMEAIVSEGVAKSSARYYVHPGELSWWMFHSDQRRPDTWWIQGDDGFCLLVSTSPSEISVFMRPGQDPMPLIRWCRQRLGDGVEVGWVSTEDHELEAALEEEGGRPVFVYRSYRWNLAKVDVPEPALPDGWVLRHVSSEDEADNRRAASHAAFESTMPRDMHLDRYLRFMRSPTYTPERDLVAVAPDGRIGAFMVWWADPSGIAQIEPFGTHPDFHRQGIGRALIYHGLHQMRSAGMTTARVCTDDPRSATDFYEGVGFEDIGRLRWWALRSE